MDAIHDCSWERELAVGGQTNGSDSDSMSSNGASRLMQFMRDGTSSSSIFMSAHRVDFGSVSRVRFGVVAG